MYAKLGLLQITEYIDVSKLFSYSFLHCIIQVGFILFRRHYMTTVEVTCKDKSYNWLLQWIATHGAKDTQHLR